MKAFDTDIQTCFIPLCPRTPIHGSHPRFLKAFFRVAAGFLFFEPEFDELALLPAAVEFGGPLIDQPS
jgi:hypothetical protein